jgi:hypothetical protein
MHKISMFFHQENISRRAAWLVLVTSLTLLLAVFTRPPATAEPGAVNGTVGRWSPPQWLASGAYGPVLRTAPNGAMMVVYGQATDGSTFGQINPHYRTLPEDSTIWSTASPIHSSSTNLSQVTFEFDASSKAHAVWRSNTAVFYSPQDQWGGTQPATVFNNGSRLVFDPDLAIGNNALHVVASMQDQTGANPENIHHAFSTDGGLNWTLTALTSNTRQSKSPSVALDAQGNVHVVWEEWLPDPGPDPDPDDPYIYQIFHRTGIKSGSIYSWGATQLIFDNVPKARRPALLAHGSTLHVTFTNLISKSEQYVYYLHRPAGSAVWTQPVNITGDKPLAVNNNAPFYLVSNMIICQDKVQTFYYGSPVFDTNEQVYLQPAQIQSRELVTDSSARRVRPSAVCHNNALHLVYEEIVTPNVNHQIYFTSALEQLYLPIIVRN